MMTGKGLYLFAPMVLLGCSTMPLGAGKALAQQPTDKPADEPADQARSDDAQSDMDSQLMFELMIAELAGRRGQLDVAMAGYLSASERTDDSRVAERATRLAVFGRQWDEAEKAARRWSSLDPDNTEAPRMLGQTLLYQDKVDDAVKLYTSLLTAEGERRPLLRTIQFELQQNENPSTSVAVMQQLAGQFGEEVEAHIGLARAHITDSQPDAALAAIEQGLQIAPQDTDALLLRAQILSSMDDADAAFSSLSTALEAYPQNTELRLGFAQLLVNAGRFEQVSGELDTLHSQSAQAPDTLLAISMMAIESDHLDRATVYLTDLKASGTHTDQASFYLGRLSDDKKAFEQALVHYDDVGEGELYFNAQVRAAELTALAGDLEQSRERLRQLAAQSPQPLLQTRLVAAESRILQNAEQDAEALVVLTEGLERFPDNVDLLYARALVAQSTDDAPMMIADLNRLIEVDAQNAHALNALGYYYADENIELEQAEELLVKANELLPQDPAIMDSLGWLRFRQGRYDEAVTVLRSAYELYPDPEIAAHLGAALWRSGAEQEAQALITEALLSQPEDEKLLAVEQEFFK